MVKIARKTIGSWSPGVDLTCYQLFRMADDGHPRAKMIIDAAIDRMAVSMANTLHLLNPDIVVIGGGLAKEKDRIFVPLRERVDRLLMDTGFKVPIVPAELEEPGLWGALYLALDPPTQA